MLAFPWLRFPISANKIAKVLTLALLTLSLVVPTTPELSSKASAAGACGSSQSIPTDAATAWQAVRGNNNAALTDPHGSNSEFRPYKASMDIAADAGSEIGRAHV